MTTIAQVRRAGSARLRCTAHRAARKCLARTGRGSRSLLAECPIRQGGPKRSKPNAEDGEQPVRLCPLEPSLAPNDHRACNERYQADACERPVWSSLRDFINGDVPDRDRNRVSHRQDQVSRFEGMHGLGSVLRNVRTLSGRPEPKAASQGISGGSRFAADAVCYGNSIVLLLFDRFTTAWERYR